MYINKLFVRFILFKFIKKSLKIFQRPTLENVVVNRKLPYITHSLFFTLPIICFTFTSIWFKCVTIFVFKSWTCFDVKTHYIIIYDVGSIFSLPVKSRKFYLFQRCISCIIHYLNHSSWSFCGNILSTYSLNVTFSFTLESNSI